MRDCRLQTTDRGFTLVEILISIVLLVVILGAVYSSFFTVNTALERFDGVSLRYHEARIVLDIIRREIETAILRNTENEKALTLFVINDRDIFGITTSELEFTTLSLRNNLPIRITYSVGRMNDRLSLVKKVSSIDTGQRETTGFSLEMIDNINGFAIETLFDNKWIRTWDTDLTGKLPEVVKITIRFDDRGRDVRLSEYARPMIGRRL